MKKLAILAIVATASLTNLVAHADGLYLKGGAAKSYSTEKDFTVAGQKYENNSDGVGYGIGVGLELSPELALELDVRSRKNVFKNTTTKTETKARSYTGMVNGVYHLDAGQLKPYAKAGIGLDRFKEGKDYEHKFAWNIGAGVNYYLTDNMALNLDYTYLNGAEKTFNNTKLDNNAHEIMAGIRFDF